jgi:hypothetical protein
LIAKIDCFHLINEFCKWPVNRHFPPRQGHSPSMIRHKSKNGEGHEQQHAWLCPTKRGVEIDMA